MKAVQRFDDCIPCDLAPGEWCWRFIDYTSKGGPAHHKSLCFHTPNPAAESYGMLDWRWNVTGDGETITVSPSINLLEGRKVEEGAWHGFLVNGEWKG